MTWLLIALGAAFVTWFVWAIIYGFWTGRMWIDLNCQGRPIIGIWIL